MAELTVNDFEEYFLQVHGHEPYPWQTRLTQHVLSEGLWPKVIDLPTGTGKTAVLDTALFALAAQPEISPRRIVFVIDRRIVVDQVFKRAEKIRDAINKANSRLLKELKKQLVSLSEDCEPLGVAALRGGVPMDGAWYRRPDQPWVMVSTVDQFGSRLLFRGYGVGEKTRSIHAGLAGNDCLVILDEVHLSRAFSETLRDISSTDAIPRICAVGDELPRRFQVVEMSATPTDPGATTFRLSDADKEASTLLKQIAEAPKQAELVKLKGNRPAESIPKKVVNLISELHDDEMSVGVVVNRVLTAREVYASLKKKGIKSYLVTGRMRPIDRIQLLEEINNSGCVDPDRKGSLAERTVVVATQAIEVGADFSFDALITEAAPIDSLRQRLGRLDRRGKLAATAGRGPARCWILGVESALNPKKPDPVYGEGIAKTWDAIVKLSGWKDNGLVDVSPNSAIFDELGSEVEAPKSEAPLLLPTHIGAWTQTSPKPVADPSIADFLHGKDHQGQPDVSVVWRADRSKEVLELVPPCPAEYLTVPIYAVKYWLNGSVEAPMGDTISVPPPDDKRRDKAFDRKLTEVFKWSHGELLVEEVESADQLQPGDVILVDPLRGGIRDGTWDPSFRPAKQEDDRESSDESSLLDIGDQAQAVYGKRKTLRLDPLLLVGFGLPPIPLPKHEQDMETDQTREEIIKTWLCEAKSANAETIPRWFVEVIDVFKSKTPKIEVVTGTGEGQDYYVLLERLVDPTLLDFSDNRPSLTESGTSLKSHLTGVGKRVAQYAKRLRLSEALIEDLRLAGELHDLGKIDKRFQAQMHGHDPVSIASAAGPLAKSLRGARPRPKDWPKVRHEFSSVALAQSNTELLARAHDADLVLHLIGSHHGYSRPLPKIKDDPEPQQLNVTGKFLDGRFELAELGNDEEQDEANSLLHLSTTTAVAETPLALEMAERFWCLQERYGHHGLAWLEAIFRLADWQQSAEESQ